MHKKTKKLLTDLAIYGNILIEKSRELQEDEKMKLIFSLVLLYPCAKTGFLQGVDPLKIS
jgi:hypothetical protein